ncbi:enoyl-CoA hydratase/isomerase family protein [Microbacterium sp. A588]
MSVNTIELHREGPVGWLIFNRPDAGNAMNADMMTALPLAWRELDEDPAVRCIVVTGRGRAFQTGLDVVALAHDPKSLSESARRTRAAALQLTGWHLGVRTPVVTAVNGVCAGGGLHFVVDSDIAIASEKASFVDPHVSVGQASSWEAIGLMRRIPATVASRMALIGAHERVSAQRAYESGLVSELVVAERLQERAQELAEQVADQPPSEAQAIKARLWATMELGRRSIHPTASFGDAHLEEKP